MGKIGKILAPVVAIFAIAVLVMSFLVAKQGKLFRQRSQVLAEGLVKAAKTLDSGSGDAGKVTFTPAENGNPEDGALGWPKFVESSDSYSSSANAVDALARKVISQRDYIIDQLVSTSVKLEAPAEKRPDAETLAKLPSYEEGADGFFKYVENRVARDKNVAMEINRFASQVNVKGTFNGEVQEGGVLTSTDKRVFTEMAGNVGNLKNNYKAYQNFFRGVSQTLARVRLEQGTLRTTNANAPALNNDGLAAKDVTDIKSMLDGFTADLTLIQGQLARIPQLKNEIEEQKAAIAELQDKVAEWKAKYEQDEEVIQNYYKQGLGMSSATNDKVKKNNYEDMRKDLSGEILQVDAKFGYVIVNLTDCDVVKDVIFSVHRLSDGKYLGLIKILSAGEFNAIATTIGGDISSMSVGDKVVVGSAAIQDFRN